jgi:hypothetical protein
MWIGGKSAKSLERAIALAEGWVPFGLGLAGYTALLDRVELPVGFEVVLPVNGLDPAGAPEKAMSSLTATVAAGATVVNASLRSQSAAHYVEQLEALASIVELETP